MFCELMWRRKSATKLGNKDSYESIGHTYLNDELLWWSMFIVMYADVKGQKAVSAHFTGKQICWPKLVITP